MSRAGGSCVVYRAMHGVLMDTDLTVHTVALKQLCTPLQSLAVQHDDDNPRGSAPAAACIGLCRLLYRMSW